MYRDETFRFYDKRHLFALGEEQAFFEPGEDKTIITVKGWRVCPLICYDLRFPVWSRLKSNGIEFYEYDILVYIANWPIIRIDAWDTLLSARAIENQSYCIGVNRIGIDEQFRISWTFGRLRLFRSSTKLSGSKGHHFDHTTKQREYRFFSGKFSLPKRGGFL